MNLLCALYGATVNWRNRLYDRRVFDVRKLQSPVVSVGSISAGGAGKTPFVMMIGELLKQRGVDFNVLSRGYGRQSKGVRQVDPAGSAQEFGDEPLLIARKLRVPVIVGEDRCEAGRFAEEKFGLQAHLLDDGFQHRRLARDFDIALLTARDLHDQLLPAGKLREPLSALVRASALVLMDGASPDRLDLRESQHLWRVKRSIVPPQTKEPCFAFCGIARPENFFTALAAAGVQVTGSRAFRDHHAYTEQDVECLYRQGQFSGASAFVATEKDAINLGEFAARLRPLHVVPVTMAFAPGSAQAMESIAAVILRDTSPA